MSKNSQQNANMSMHPDLVAAIGVPQKARKVKRRVAGGGSSSVGNARFPTGTSKLGRGYAVGNYIVKDGSPGMILFCINKDDWLGKEPIVGPCKHVPMKMSEVKFDGAETEEVAQE